MARLATYSKDTSISVDDLLIGTDAEDSNITKNFTVGALKNYMGGSILKETTITLGYNELSLLNGGTTTTTFAIPELTSNSALAIVDVLAYIEAGTTAFDLNTLLQVGVGTGVDFKPRARVENALLNSSSSVFYARGTNDSFVDYIVPSPLGAELSIRFGGTGAITQGNGKLTLKVLYRLVDFS